MRICFLPRIARIFAKNFKNSCEFAKFAAGMFNFPVKNGRTSIFYRVHCKVEMALFLSRKQV